MSSQRTLGSWSPHHLPFYSDGNRRPALPFLTDCRRRSLQVSFMGLEKLDYSLKFWAFGKTLCIWEEGLKYPYLIFNSSIPFRMHPALKSRRVVANLGNGIGRPAFHPRNHSSSQFSCPGRRKGLWGHLGEGFYQLTSFHQHKRHCSLFGAPQAPDPRLF